MNVPARSIARTHRFFRGTKGVTVLGAPDPFDIPAIDVQVLTEAAIKAHVDTAVANRNLVVFLVHGGLTAGNLTTFGNVIDYIDSLGCPQGRFDEAIMARTSIRGSAGMMIDTQGNARFLDARATRFEVHRTDVTAGKGWWDIDEVTSRPYFQSDGPNIEFRTNTTFWNGANTGKRRTVGDGVTTNASTAITSGAAAFALDDIGITISGAGIPVGTTIANVTTATAATLSAPATATATNVVFTLGRPLPGTLNLNSGLSCYGNVNVVGTATPEINFQLAETTAQGLISATTWSRAGTGGAMTIDSGTGGSNIDVKGARLRVISQANARKIALGTAAPSDASIANGEVVLWFDGTVGAAKLMLRGKDTAGTVVNANIPLT